MSLTVRVRRSARRPFLVWVAVGLATTLAGPLGASIPARAATSSSPDYSSIVRRPDPPRTPPAYAAPRPMGKLSPTQGALFGITSVPDDASGDPTKMDITRHQTDAGRTLDIDSHYYAKFDAGAGPHAYMPGAREQTDLTNGRIPMISWSGGDSLAITAGSDDTIIDQTAARLKAFGHPFFLRYSWEMERASNAGATHTAADFIAAWRYLYNRMVVTDGMTNAAWVWCPVSLDFYPPPRGLNPAQPYYPGDQYVDWICADGYDWAPHKPGAEWESFQELFQDAYNFDFVPEADNNNTPHNKPFMVGETGAEEMNPASGSTPGDKATWIDEMHQSVMVHYPNLEAFVYFDHNDANGLGNDFRVDTSPDAYSAWKAMANDPYFNVRSTVAEAPYNNTNVTPLGPSTPTTPTTPTTPQTPVGPPPGPNHIPGYSMLGADGTVYAFGAAANDGNGAAGVDAVHLEPTPSGKGYWLLEADGRVGAFGDATSFGDVPVARLAAGETVSSLSATPSGKGYWVFTNRGRALTFGDATFLGDVSQLKLNGPVLGSVATPSGMGYYMVASDGGIFAFGDAVFKGSMGATRLNAPVQSLVPTADGSGYWLVASDGGIFAFGGAPFRGSTGNIKLNKPVVGMVRYADGYLMVASDGGVFDFSSSPFLGSLGAHPPARPIVSVAAVDVTQPAT